MVDLSYSFGKLSDYLKKSVKVLNTETNFKVNLTPVDKIIWVHMLSKYLSFRKSGLLYFETQGEMSLCTGIGLTAVKSSLKKLKSIPVICTTKKQVQGYKFFTVYTKIHLPEECNHLLFFDIQGAEIQKSSFQIRSKSPSD